MKICCTCKIEKDPTNFCKSSRLKDGLAKQCKDCEHARKRKYYYENIELTRKKKRESAEKHKEKRHAYQKNKYYLNLEESRKLGRNKYWKNREAIRERCRQKNKTPEQKKKNNERVKKWSKEKRELRKEIFYRWAKKNRDLVNELHKKWRKKNREQSLANQMIIDHVRRGTLIRGTKCQICGTEKGKMQAHHTDYTKPLDVQWLCHICHCHQHNKLLDISPNKDLVN